MDIKQQSANAAEISSDLSHDITTITAEIQTYKRIAGEAIFEIGRRLKHVKENDLTHGEWSKWCEEEAGFSIEQARKFMRVYDTLGAEESTTSWNLGLNVLYEIATLPPAERDKPQAMPDGTTKTPDEMTVRELRELKKRLKEAESNAAKAHDLRLFYIERVNIRRKKVNCV